MVSTLVSTCEERIDKFNFWHLGVETSHSLIIIKTKPGSHNFPKLLLIDLYKDRDLEHRYTWLEKSRGGGTLCFFAEIPRGQGFQEKLPGVFPLFSSFIAFLFTSVLKFA